MDDTGGDDDDEPRRAPPPGHGRAGSMTDAPEDTVVEDPALPRGVIVVTIKDGQDLPIARAPVKLTVLHSSVAKGDSTEELTREGDALGSIRFEGMTSGSGTSYRVVTTRGPATYSVGPFALSDQQGKRVVLHSYEVVTDLENAPVGMQGIAYLQLREDSIVIEQLFSIFNLGSVAWAPNITVPLPEGFKAFNKQDTASDVRVDEVSGKGFAIRGTVAPGRQDVTFRYQVPLSGDERQTLRIGLPPRVAQGRVMVEVSKTMGVEVAGFPPAQKTNNREGKRLLVTEAQAPRAEGGLRTFEITLTGLPTHGPGRWVAAAIAAAAIIGAAIHLLQSQGSRELPDDARDDLLDAREALLGEIVELERAHRRGDIGPKTYERLRGALLDSLARIVSMLEGDRASKRANSRPARAGSSGAADSP